MSLDAILASLFPGGHDIATGNDGTIAGRGVLHDGQRLAVIGLVDGGFLGVDEALRLALHVLDVVQAGDGTPILVIIDSTSQRMSRRDELLGLSQYLAHLAKALLFARASGHPTLGLLYGGSAAGAFIATALATAHLVALPGADPAVMDLPSMARVTKLPLDRLQAMARDTPVFAPGLDNIARMGAVHAVLDPAQPLGPQIVPFLAAGAQADGRDAAGAARGGRTLAASVANRVREAAESG